ncbi:MAG TPA: LssY C-terminal domain-containing protein [Bryobacteraceae bacterium]|nr:LssY C-terminal domain-containing protein [Bryobacteraceae bacterium]
MLIGPASAAELPAGTTIEIRLKTKVASNASRHGDPVEAVVINPVLSGELFVIPFGAVVRGKVEKAQPSPSADKRAVLDLHFDELVAAANKSVKLAAKVTAVDNARESVDEKGAIQGILAAETLSARMDQGLTKLGQRASGLAEILQLAKNAVVKTTDSEIVYEPGVEMTIQLTAKVIVDPAAIPGIQVSFQPFQSEAELQALVNAQPFLTVAAKPPKESDITNLMFIGSQQELESAFEAAGWVTAAALNPNSSLETFKAIAEMRGYKEAPMSTLLLEGRPPEFNYQKQNNTFAMRHHLRIWKRPQQWQGRDVWVSSSTHDTGIEFSQENRTFIHRVDSNIDAERAKVVSDLTFTGKVVSVALVDRPAVPKECMNATGDKLVTDGRMAVLALGGR